MGNRHRLDEVLPKARLDRGLDLLDATRHVFDPYARSLVEQRDTHSCAGGIAGRSHVLQRAVRHDTEHHGVLDTAAPALR